MRIKTTLTEELICSNVNAVYCDALLLEDSRQCEQDRLPFTVNLLGR